MSENWRLAKHHLAAGNFTVLQDVLGGGDEFDCQIVSWFNDGKFADEPELLAEVLSCACMLGRTDTAAFLIDRGVAPYAGIKTGLAGPHYAASSGRLETIKMLLDRNIDLEVENMYGGTVLGQTLWSAVNELSESHAEIIELLIDAGANVEPGTLEWWQEQSVPSAETKQRVLDALRKNSAQ
ncbi:MAG: ankyrin repeat domain-containing protein [Pyrinomonadaceae bacterium]|nr:ankyrin repeat domain-containing protein [Pyrinomonadaceae bacterium]